MKKLSMFIITILVMSIAFGAFALESLEIDYNVLAEYTILISQGVLKKDDSIQQQANDLITPQLLIIALAYPEGTIDVLMSQISSWAKTEQGATTAMLAALMYDNESTRDQAIELLAATLKDVIILPKAK